MICEVVEIKEKPSLPIGEIGMDAFGNVPKYEDKGILKRAIVGIGKQDIDIEGIVPIDSDIEILGASSDHMILNVSNSKQCYEVGDKVEFLVEYGGLLTSCTSKYVHKELVYSEFTQKQEAY
jgi:predicted amino acid racemase